MASPFAPKASSLLERPPTTMAQEVLASRSPSDAGVACD
jgi:hypothetical protein